MGNNEDRIITPTMIRTEVADNCCYWGKQFSAEDIGHIAEVADNILINDARFQEERSLLNHNDIEFVPQFGAFFVVWG